MSRRLRRIAVMAVLTIATTSQVTPVEKVITLLEGMKSDIEKEAKSEAESYDKFACFCKDTTMKKSTSITEGQDTIDKLSASIAEKTAIKETDQSSVAQLKAKKEALSKDLADNTARCATEKAEYEALAADFNKAISSLKSAIKAMADKKKAMDSVKAASALLEVDSGLRDTLDLADSMGFVKAPKQKAFLQGFSTSLLQGAAAQDPNDKEYTYHSSDIVELLESLNKDFTKEKATLDTEYGKTSTACSDLKKSLSGKIESNTKETKTTDEKISKTGGEIADDRGKLVEAQDLMKDDELYLKDLTARCEERAGNWDQRSSMRAGEIQAISTALKVLGDRVKPADSDVNARALLQKPTSKLAHLKADLEARHKEVATKAGAKETVSKSIETKNTDKAKVAPSFLQRIVVSEHSGGSIESTEQIVKDQAVATLKNEGLRLKSPVLTALAMQVAADPFKKVKTLIQGLIERLIKEAAQEATKKGFCDTELGKAKKDRDFRYTRVKKISAKIAMLEAKEDSLTEEIEFLTKSIESMGKAMEESTSLRQDEKEGNAKTIKTASEGLEAVNEAILVLKSFYKEASKAASFIQASPVDEDTDGAGFSGAYKGKQESSNAVISLLQTIASDFERTLRSTESEEETAARMYVKNQRVTKADIAGKTTKKELDEQDLKTTKNQLEVSRADLQTNMDLVDDAVKTLMELKPTCIDTGMSYTERVEKREEEVKALKKALCILDTEKVEAECK